VAPAHTIARHGQGVTAMAPRETAMQRLDYRIARSSDFEAIHRLNYHTFVDEIPQHSPNEERRLVDRFHDENTYIVCADADRVVGMVCGRCTRPFSLDQKLPDLDQWLPRHRKAVEIRLLAIVPEHRKTAVFASLVRTLAEHCIESGCDLALVSGTVRELKLYRHLGFEPFAQRVGSAEASYQPMYLTLQAFGRSAVRARASAS
jgi:predicted N-acetyltransferase YhbS